MNQFHFKFISFMLMISSATVVLTSPAANDENLKDLYDFLLTREYAEPLALDPQMERKAVRSPSMRLRFGRSDPNFPFVSNQNYQNTIEQKPIRSPSMRLRFGRRSDPLMQMFEDNKMFGNEAMTRKFQRTPSVRLRFGKRSDSSSYDVDDEVHEVAEQQQDN